jgi:hypothetical protein
VGASRHSFLIVFHAILPVVIEIGKHDHAILWRRTSFVLQPLFAGTGSHECDNPCMRIQRCNLMRQDGYQVLNAFFFEYPSAFPL